MIKKFISRSVDPTVEREGHVIVLHEVKLLDIIMDNALLLDIHMREVCEKASRKLSALSRLANENQFLIP